MKLWRLPLWLFCDLIAALGVMWSLMQLDAAASLIMTRMDAEGRDGMTAEDRARLAPILGHAESWRRYALMRQAFRITGLDPRDVRWREIIIPASPRHVLFRLIAFIRDTRRLNHLARQFAAKITRVMEARDPAPAHGLSSRPEARGAGEPGSIVRLSDSMNGSRIALRASGMTSRGGLTAAHARAPPAHAARGPPRARLPVPDCLRAQASEVAPVSARHKIPARAA